MPASITIKTSGKILVSEGKAVVCGEVIACEQDNPVIVRVNLSKSLSVSPKTCKKLLAINLGKPVKLSEVIAKKKSFLGLGKKTVKSPCNGILEELTEETGELSISLPKVTKEIKSLVNGKIKKINNNEIVISLGGEEIILLKAMGNFCQGSLRIIKEEADLSSLSADDQGKIIVGNTTKQDFLEKALALGVAGIIVIDILDSNWDEAEKGKDLLIGSREEKIMLNLGVLKKEDWLVLEKFQGKKAIFDPINKKLIILS